MNDTRNVIGRRGFLKRVGLAAPVVFGGSSAMASVLFSPRGREVFGGPRMRQPLENSGLIKPERLRFGDVVGVVAPASAPSAPEATDRELAALARLGFQPRLAPNARKRLGFLAGTDKERAEDLMDMFTDSEVKAIFCLRGGYGSARILPLLDYGTIRRHPKILVGFSDITSLLCALLTHAKLVSFHGPTLNTNLTSDRPSPFTLHSLLRTVMDPVPSGQHLRRLRAKDHLSIAGRYRHRTTRRGKFVGAVCHAGYAFPAFVQRPNPVL